MLELSPPQIQWAAVTILVSLGVALLLHALPRWRVNYAMGKAAPQHIGTLGRSFWVIWSLPMAIEFIFFVTSILLVIAYAHALLSKGLVVSQFLLAVAFLFVSICIVAYNWIGAFVQKLLYFVDSFPFTPSWLAATAMKSGTKPTSLQNIDNDRIATVASLLWDAVLTEYKPYGMVPTVGGLDESETANRLLFQCAMERAFSLAAPEKSRELTKDMIQLLETLSRMQADVFKPEHLRALQIAGESMPAVLNRTARDHDLTDRLPEIALLRDYCDDVLERLVRIVRGDASRLARYMGFPRQGSSRILNARLRSFPHYEVSSTRRLFTKLALRHGAWPRMKPGPFQFPYNGRLALMLLNTGCVTAGPGCSHLSSHNAFFRRIVAYAESYLTSAFRRRFRSRAMDSEVRIFSESVFSRSPNDVMDFELDDYLDWWLWDHAGEFCSRAPDSLSKPCPVRSPGGDCACDSLGRTWQIRAGDLRRLTSEGLT